MSEDANKNTGGNSDTDFSKEALDEALKEFDSSGGFSGQPKPSGQKPAPPKSPSSQQTVVNVQSGVPKQSSGQESATPANPPSPRQAVVIPKPKLEEEFPNFDDGIPSQDNIPSKDVNIPEQKPKAVTIVQQTANNKDDIDDDFDDMEEDDIKNVHHAKQNSDNTDTHSDLDTEFDDIDDDILDSELIDDKVPSGGGKGGGTSGGGGNGGDSRKDLIIKKLKEPKNAIILGIAVLFLIFLLFVGGGKRKVKTQRVSEMQEVAQDVANEVNEVKKDANIQPLPEDSKSTRLSDVSLADIQLPNLDIQIPDVRPTNVDLIPNIPEPKSEEPKIPDIKTPEIKLPDIDETKKNIIIEKTEKQKLQEEQIDIKSSIKRRDREPIEDQSDLKPLITDFTGGTKITSVKTPNKDSKDFIFVDADLDVESEQNVIKATKIQDPENVVAQGRIIDAVLETAINSTIGGQVRAVVTRDVYAETGKNIMIPKGTRLYGEYGNANSKSADRIIITWTRIMRPDNISATINSFAADQFGRSGIQGQVDNKYFSNITTSILLSTIPLVTTIVTNAITNSRQNNVTTTGAGGTTIIQDPVNIATQAFTQQIGQATSDIIKNIGDMKPTIILEQGTRVKVLVNQDIKLPKYKPITRTSSGVTT